MKHIVKCMFCLMFIGRVVYQHVGHGSYDTSMFYNNIHHRISGYVSLGLTHKSICVGSATNSNAYSHFLFNLHKCSCSDLVRFFLNEIKSHMMSG